MATLSIAHPQWSLSFTDFFKMRYIYYKGIQCPLSFDNSLYKRKVKKNAYIQYFSDGIELCDC